MFQKNIIIALRSIYKNKLQTIINILGLAIGIAGCLTVFRLVTYEYGFNKNIVDGDRIYRIYTQFNGQFPGVNPGVPYGMPNLAAIHLPDAETQCHFHTYRANVSIPGERGVTTKRFANLKDLVVVGPEYFDLLQNYEWQIGSPRQSLSQPFQVVLTESKALRYFGLKDVTEAVGREIIYADSLKTKVSGILSDPVVQSDFYFTDFISDRSLPNSFLNEIFPSEGWDGVNSSDQFLIKAARGVTTASLEKQLDPLNTRLNANNVSGEDLDEFKLQPLSDLHFNRSLGIFDYSRIPIFKTTLEGLILIAILLLLIAAINFINLATVQATRRAKETGIRKVIGASPRQIAVQFLMETVLITILAIPVAIILAQLSMNYFAEFLPGEMTINVFSPDILLFLLISVIVVTFLAGVYPSLVMSSFHPMFAIKNQSVNGGQTSGGLRKGMIVFQFILAQSFIIGALVVDSQMRFALHHDLGFDQEAIVYFNTDYRAEASRKITFQNEVEKLPEVKMTSLQSKPPIDRGYQMTIMDFELNNQKVKSEVHIRWVDTTYLELYNIELLAGRNLAPSDTIKELLINETFAHEMGFQQPWDAVGAMISYGDKMIPVIGVVQDFHVRSYHHGIPSVAIATQPSYAFSVAAKIGTNQPIGTTLDKFQTIWEKIYPNQEFQAYFLSDMVEGLYKSEVQISKLINTAAGLVIVVSCLGLLGLAFFTVTQRTKEISIRKVLGASIASVVRMLSMDFLKLVIIALFIASPLAYYFMEKWLEGFAFSIQIQWWMFMLSGLFALIMAFLTIGFQSVKAATAHPVKNLRIE